MKTKYTLALPLAIMYWFISDALATECTRLTPDGPQQCVTCRVDPNYNDVQWALLCDNICDNTIQVETCYKGEAYCGESGAPPRRSNYPIAFRYRIGATPLAEGSEPPTWKVVCDKIDSNTSSYNASGLAKGGPVALPSQTPMQTLQSSSIQNPEQTSTDLKLGPKEGTIEFDQNRCNKLNAKRNDCVDAILKKGDELIRCQEKGRRNKHVTIEQCREQVNKKYDVIIGKMESEQAHANCNRLKGQVEQFRCNKSLKLDKDFALESEKNDVKRNKDRAPLPPPEKDGIDKLNWDNLRKKAIPQGANTTEKLPKPVISKSSSSNDVHQDCYLKKSACELSCSGASCQSCEDQWYDCRWKE